MNHVLVDDPPRPRGVSGEGVRRRHVEDDRDRGDLGRSRALEQGVSRGGFDIGGINHGELPCSEAPIQLAMQAPERGTGRPLIGLVA